MTSMKCCDGCNAKMGQVTFKLYCAENVPAWVCLCCGKWVYSEQVRYLYMNQLYLATTTRTTYEVKVEEVLREGVRCGQT
jgi:hypothetical protein